MFLGRQNQHSKNDKLTKSNLQIQCNSQQNSSQTSKEWYSTSYGKAKKPRIAETILYNKGTSGGITIPDVKPYNRDTVQKTTWYWHKNRKEDQIEDPDINLHTYEHLISDKEAKKYKMEKRMYI